MSGGDYYAVAGGQGNLFNRPHALDETWGRGGTQKIISGVFSSQNMTKNRLLPLHGVGLVR